MLSLRCPQFKKPQFMIKLFRERPIRDAFAVIEKNAERKVDTITESGITGEIKDEHIKMITESLQIHPIDINFDDRKVDVKMVNIKGSHFPPQYDVQRGKNYLCAMVSYEYKANGNQELLSIHPTTANFNRNLLVDVIGNALTINIQTLYGNSELNEKTRKEVKNEIIAITDDMKIVIEALNNEVEEFNKGINQMVIDKVNARKEIIEKREKQKNDLNDF
tara:strand:- start:5007 stop:5666 length:660 start_codon:yes stop_codon:yes gene_type:complete